MRKRRPPKLRGPAKVFPKYFRIWNARRWWLPELVFRKRWSRVLWRMKLQGASVLNRIHDALVFVIFFSFLGSKN